MLSAVHPRQGKTHGERTCITVCGNAAPLPCRLALTVTGAKSMPSCSTISTSPLEASLKVPLICTCKRPPEAGASEQATASMLPCTAQCSTGRQPPPSV